MNFAPSWPQARDAVCHLRPSAGRTTSEERPSVLARAKGVYLRDGREKECADIGAGLWGVSLGHGEERSAVAASTEIEDMLGRFGDALDATARMLKPVRA